MRNRSTPLPRGTAGLMRSRDRAGSLCNPRASTMLTVLAATKRWWVRPQTS
jgi:hypothetical protein